MAKVFFGALVLALTVCSLSMAVVGSDVASDVSMTRSMNIDPPY